MGDSVYAARLRANIQLEGSGWRIASAAGVHVQELAAECMSHVPEERPTFAQIMPRLEAMLAALPQEERDVVQLLAPAINDGD